MKKSFVRKGRPILLIIVLFIGASIIPSTIGTIKEKTVLMNLGSPGYIQDLIDNASDGDIIFIPSGSYYENIIINKSISLVGEDKNTTIIDGNHTGDVIKISADWVNISGFTIRYGNNFGLYITSDNNTITGNIITNNYNGILLGTSNNNNVTGNNITYNSFRGLLLEDSYFNNIFKNNFIGNKNQIFFFTIDYKYRLKTNKWRQNYWNKPRFLPKLLPGICVFLPDYVGPPPRPFIPIPWFTFDWRPAKEPYDI